MNFDDDTIKAVKSHSAIPGVLFRLMADMKKNGKGYVAKVPWRDDEHPSLSVWQHGNAWYWQDMAGKDKGDVIALIQRLNNLSFPAAVRWLANELGVHVADIQRQPTPIQGPADNHDDGMALQLLEHLYALSRPVGESMACSKYLEGRGLLEAAETTGVRGCDPGEPVELLTIDCPILGTPVMWIKRRLPFLIYPGVVEGRTITHRCRLLMSHKQAQAERLPAAHWNPSTQKSLTLPNIWPTLPESTPAKVYIVEGETDCLALRYLIGQDNVYATLGTSRWTESTPEVQRLIDDRAEVVIALNRDTAGVDAAKGLAAIFSRGGVEAQIVIPASGVNDWADMRATSDYQGVKIEEISVPLGDYSVALLFNALNKRIMDYTSGRMRNIPILFKTLDWVFNEQGLPGATIGLLSSRTGVGKTWFVYQFALAVVGYEQTHTPIPVFVLNTEMDEAVVAGRLLSLVSRDSSAAQISDPEKTKALQFEYQREVDSRPLHITPPEPRTCDDVVALISEKIKQYPLVIVDHMGDLSFTGKSWEVLPKMIMQLRDISRHSGSTIMIVTHLKTGEEGDILSYSRQVENIVDWSFSLSAHEEHEAEVNMQVGTGMEVIDRTLFVRKNRFGRSNVRIGMKFSDADLRYQDKGRLMPKKKRGKHDH